MSNSTAPIASLDNVKMADLKCWGEGDAVCAMMEEVGEKYQVTLVGNKDWAAIGFNDKPDMPGADIFVCAPVGGESRQDGENERNASSERPSGDGESASNENNDAEGGNENGAQGRARSGNNGEGQGGSGAQEDGENGPSSGGQQGGENGQSSGGQQSQADGPQPNGESQQLSKRQDQQEDQDDADGPSGRRETGQNSGQQSTQEGNNAENSQNENNDDNENGPRPAGEDQDSNEPRPAEDNQDSEGKQSAKVTDGVQVSYRKSGGRSAPALDSDQSFIDIVATGRMEGDAYGCIFTVAKSDLPEERNTGIWAYGDDGVEGSSEAGAPEQFVIKRHANDARGSFKLAELMDGKGDGDDDKSKGKGSEGNDDNSAAGMAASFGILVMSVLAQLF